jgi:O-antigen ligase
MMVRGLPNILFVCGLWLAGSLAVGLDPFACGIPLLVMAASLATGEMRNPAQILTAWSFLVAAVVGYFVLRMWFSPCKDFARSDGLLLAGCVLGAWWTAGASQRSLRMTLLIGLGVLVVVNITTAFAQLADIDFYPIYLKRATITFPSGLYSHYNHFANFLLGAGLFGLGMALMSSTVRWMKFSFALIYLLSIAGCVISNSRGAFLGLGCGTAVIVVGWLSDLWRRKHSWAGVALVIATVAAPLTMIGAWNIGSKMLAHRQGGDSGRLEFASIAMELIGDRPWIGGGSRSFYLDYVKKWNPDELWTGSGDIEYVHNEYLQAAVDYGLLGAGLLLTLFLVAFFRGVASLAVVGTKDRSEGEILGSMGALIGMGVQAFFSFVYHVLPDVILMGCFLSVLLLRSQVTDPAKGVSVILKRFVGVFLAITVAWVALADARAWSLLRPGMAHHESPSVRADNFAQALAIRPDFRLYSAAASHLVKMNAADLDQDKNRSRAEKALEYQLNVVKRAPGNLLQELNLALIYDSLGKYQLSEPIYERIVKPLEPRESFYGARLYYATHLMIRASLIWKNREPEKALMLFLRSKEELDRLDRIGSYYIDGDHRQLRADVENNILLLQGAKIEVQE